MENNILKFKIKHKSWDMKCSGMWDSTTWELYENLTTKIFDFYGDNAIDKKYTIKLEILENYVTNL